MSCSQSAVPREGSRAGTCSTELFKPRWFGAQTGVGCAHPLGFGVTAGQGRGKEADLGFSSLSPVRVWGYLTRTHPQALPLLCHPSQHGERGGKSSSHPGLFSRVKSALCERSGHCQGSWVSFSLLRIPLPSLAVGVVYMEHFKSQRSCGRTFFFRSVPWQSHK